MQRTADMPTDANSGSPADPSTQTHSGLELSRVLAILIDNYKLILGIAVATMALGIGLALITAPQYMASSMLQFDPGATDTLSPGKEGGKLSGYRSNQEQMATQIGLLYSDSLARRVAQDLNLASNPGFGGEGGTLAERTDRAAAVVHGMVAAEPVKASLLIRVSAVSGDAAMAARVANGYAKAHIASSIERKYAASDYARKFLADQIARQKTSLEDSERSLNGYAINAGIFRQSGKDGSGKESQGGSLQQANLEKLNGALKQAEIDRISAQQRYLQSEVASSSEASGSVGPLVQQRATLRAEYNEKSRIYQADYPAMTELKARIDRIDAEIAGEEKRLTGNKRAELYGEYKAAVRIEAELRQSVAEAKGEVVTDRNRSIQYNILQREADTNRTLYDALLQRYKEVGVAAGIGQSELSMVDEAKVPDGPFRPRPIFNALAGLFAGLALGIGLAIARTLLFDTVKDPRDVRSKLNLPLLGAVPVEPEGLAPMEALQDRKSALSETYHAVRTALRFSSPAGMPKTLLITSSRPGEGKSTSAFAIAKSAANVGTKVLLIDADLRKPTFASSKKEGLGLGNLLASETALSSAVEKTRTDNLSLLPAGRFSGAEVELLSSNRMPSLVAEAAAHYDLVVIDGPPILGLADAPLLASIAEATVLVVESGASRTADVHDMIHRLHGAGARICGVILTKVARSRSQYGYAYYDYAKPRGEESTDPYRTIDAV
jgi:polysaccharide biosynthesis transport protein